MENLFDPLSDQEVTLLDRFLLERIPEEAPYDLARERGVDMTEIDEGVLCFSELDGLLTAVISGLNPVPPSRWLPAVWGEFEPAWDNAESFQGIMELMMRQMNDISGMLMQQPEDFEPIFEERALDGRIYTIVDEWCEGYMRGVDLDTDSWEAGDEEVTRLLATVSSFTDRSGWIGHIDQDLDATEKLQQQIAPSVRMLHAFWLKKRGQSPF